MSDITPELTLFNGLKMPRVGLGTAVGPGGATTSQQQDQIEAAVKSALRLGYRHIDTAARYNTEEPVGRALKECISEGTLQRHDVFVTTKLPGTGHRKQLVEPALRRSLQKLGLDYVDLYLIHFPVSLQPGDDFQPKRDSSGNVLFDEDHTDIVTTWQAMEHCQKMGLTRSIGLSNFNEQQIERILNRCSIPPSVLQVESHPYHNNAKLVDFCRAKGIPVTCWAPLFPSAKAKFTNLNIYEEPVFQEIASRHNRTIAQVFDFSLSEEDMGRVFNIPGKYRLSSQYVSLKGAKECPFDDQ